MAGYGMTKHHLTHRGPGWRYKLVINLSAGILSTSVVLIFAIAKFTEGAWLVVVVFPILVLVLMRLNKQYRAEASVLEMSRTERPDLAKHAPSPGVGLCRPLDLAEVEAMRYAKGLHADELTAVHFVLDEARAARLQVRWERFGYDTELRMVDCQDRHLGRAAQLLVCAGQGRPSRHHRDRVAAPSDVFAAGRPAAPRPHRRQDRPGDQPDPGRKRPDSGLRRGVAGRASASGRRR